VAALPAGRRRRRVCIYARYSTDEQNCRSIDDQAARCRRWLEEHGWGDAEIVVLSDEATSGEELARPGIDAVKQLIQDSDVDMVVAEDLARYYRDSAWLQLMVKLAKDSGVSIVAINDTFDSSDDGHQLKLLLSGFHHAQHNEDTSRRIKRAADGRWENGYAMGPLRPGYIRKPVDEQRTARTGKGPYVDEKDPSAAPIIQETFERVARGDPLPSVARFLTESGLKKSANALKAEWDDGNVGNMIKNPLYMGTEEGGKSRSQKVEMNGKRVQVPADPDSVRRREMPHLAHVSRLLWQQANDAIRKRDKAGHHPKGKNNPTFRIPRASRGPLGDHFVCAACGGKMVGQGRAGGGYRCGKALRGECWNKATAKRSVAHDRIFRAVVDRVLEIDGAVEALAQFAQRIHAEGGDIGKKVSELTREIGKLDKEIDKFAEAVGSASDVGALVFKLREREARRDRMQEELLALQQSCAVAPVLPSEETIIAAARRAADRLLAHDAEVGLLLRQLTTPIRAVPFQRIDCGLVVLRARFQLSWIELLPDDWRQLARASQTDITSRGLLSEIIEVDLFDSPAHVRLAKQALALSRQVPKLSGEQMAERLGTTRRTLYDAIKLGKLMEAQGLDEPYIELTEQPRQASRWRQRGQ